MTRTRLVALATGLGTTLATLPARASPPVDGHGGGIEWVTHLIPMLSDDPSENTGLVWLIVNFAILLWVLNKLLFIPLRKRTAKKHDTIKSQLEAATAARREAERIMSEYKIRTDRLDDEIAELMKDAEERAETDRLRIIAEAESEAERIKASARAQAQRDARRLQRELEVDIVDKAVTRAEGTLRRTFADADQRTLVDRFLTQVQDARIGGGR